MKCFIKIVKKISYNVNLGFHIKIVLSFYLFRTAWYSNPYTRGSYSFIPVGATTEHIEHLQEPLTNLDGKVRTNRTVDIPVVREFKKPTI